MSRTVVVTLTEKEYQEAKTCARANGLTLAQYVKRFPIGDQEFARRFEELKRKAIAYPLDETYSIMDLFDDWGEIPHGVRVSLGRAFYHLVKEGELPEVVPAGKSSTDVQLYKRTEQAC